MGGAVISALVVSNMASSYKLTKAEFGLRSYSVALPEVLDDSADAQSSTHVVKSRSFDLQPKDKPAGSSLKQKLKSWLKGGSTPKKTDKEESGENDMLTITHRESPLHKRSWMTGKTPFPSAGVEQVQGTDISRKI